MSILNEFEPKTPSEQEQANVLQRRVTGALGALDELPRQIERWRPQDSIVPLHGCTLELSDPGPQGYRAWYLRSSAHPDGLIMHRNSVQQLLTDTHVPRRWVDHLVSLDSQEIFVHAINDTIRAMPSANRMLRVADWDRPGGRVMAWLSTRFDRYDDGAVALGVLEALERLGSRVIECRHFGTVLLIRTAFHRVLCPIPGEAVVFGLEIQLSQFGGFSARISPYMERLVCTNGLTGKHVWRRVHLGKDAVDVVLSSEALRAQTEFIRLATRDVLELHMKEDAIYRVCRNVRDAALQLVKLDRLGERGQFNRQDRDVLRRMLTDGHALVPRPTVEEPEGMVTRWRLAQAISAYAHQVSRHERALELTQVAGTWVLES